MTTMCWMKRYFIEERTGRVYLCFNPGYALKKVARAFLPAIIGITGRNARATKKIPLHPPKFLLDGFTSDKIIF